MKVFDSYSQYYDLLYNDKNYDLEVDYVNKLIKSFNPKSKSILELGCGTGIHAGLLAKLGYTVCGIDKSDSMLEKAIQRKNNLQNNIAEKLSFNKGDVRTYRSNEQYDIVISLFHVMSYMETNEDVMQSIQTAKKHLKKNGLFIFDCWHGPAVLKDRPTSRSKIFNNENIQVTRISTPEMNLKKNTVNINFNIVIQNKKTEEENHLQEEHKMRYLFTEELNDFVIANDFKIVCAEEWLTKKPLSENTWNACYVCKKK